jgi:hypothetical protein
LKRSRAGQLPPCLPDEVTDLPVGDVVGVHMSFAPRPVPHAESDTGLFTLLFHDMRSGIHPESMRPCNSSEHFRLNGVAVTARRVAECE